MASTHDQAPGDARHATHPNPQMKAEIPDEAGPSKHAQMWWQFGSAVENHIENYVIPQYGDVDSDKAHEYDPKDCIKQAEKYLARHGKNVREGQEELDLLKAADYIMMAWHKLKNERRSGDDRRANQS
jgi:hypothetical protein